MTFFIIGIPLVLLIVIVEIAAIALNMTGLDIKKARFQALSALTLTGFTTKEAEEVVEDHRRRRIIMVLMVIGLLTWASLVSLVINAFTTAHELMPAVIQLFALVVVFLIILLLAKNRSFVRAFRNVVSRYLEHRTNLKRKSIEEVLRLAQDYGVAQITLTENSKNAGLLLKDSDFRDKDILILAIERDNKILPAPRANDILKEKDILICYGKLKNMQEIT